MRYSRDISNAVFNGIEREWCVDRVRVKIEDVCKKEKEIERW